MGRWQSVRRNGEESGTYLQHGDEEACIADVALKIRADLDLLPPLPVHTPVKARAPASCAAGSAASEGN